MSPPIEELEKLAELKRQMSQLDEIKVHLRELISKQDCEKQLLQELKNERHLLSSDREKFMLVLNDIARNLSLVNVELDAVENLHKLTDIELRRVRDEEYDAKRTLVNKIRKAFGLPLIKTISDEIEHDTFVYLQERRFLAASSSVHCPTYKLEAMKAPVKSDAKGVSLQRPNVETKVLRKSRGTVYSDKFASAAVNEEELVSNAPSFGDKRSHMEKRPENKIILPRITKRRKTKN